MPTHPNTRGDGEQTSAATADVECEYKATDPTITGHRREYVCGTCGHRRWSAYAGHQLHRRCGPPGQPATAWRPPDDGSKIRRYAKAVKKWITAGRPVRPPEEVARIFDQICVPCENFNVAGSCNLCGCKVRRNGAALMNKLAMATTNCPADPPKWTATAE